MDKTFVRVHSVKDIVIIASFVVVGIILALLPMDTGVNITGYLLVFTALALLFLLKTAYKDTQTGEKFCKKEYYFQKSIHSTIMSDIESKPESIDLSQEDSGTTIKLDIYFSKKADKAYVQLFEYIPYDYEPCSKMYEYEIARVRHLIK